MIRSILLTCVLAGLLVGCAIPGINLSPTSFPADYLPTAIYLTAESINTTHSLTVTPLITPTEQPTIIPATVGPITTFTPAPGFPFAAIRINAPGPMSKVISPLEVHLIAVAGASKKISVDLFGEDGTHLGGSTRSVSGFPSGDFLSVKIPFEIRAVGENGFVQIRTKDEQGRVQSLTTLQILLLSSGVSQLNPPGNTIYERVTFYDLPPNTTVSGGVITLTGKMVPYNQKPVVLELIGIDGKSLGTRLLLLAGLDSQDFQTTIPYKVGASTHARLFVHEDDDVLSGPAYVYSQPITLNP